MAQQATIESLNEETDVEHAIAGLIDRGRAAMHEFAGATQAQLDDAVTALAWSLYRPETAKELAEYAVEITGLGNVESKIIKNQRKTFGTLRDLMRVKSTGIIEEIPEKGLVKYAKPVGVVAAVTPVHQSLGDTGQQGDDGGQGRECNHHRAFAAGLARQQRDGRGDAGRAEEGRRAGRPGSNPAEPRDARGNQCPDARRRPRGGHRQPEQCAQRLFVRQTRDRRRGRKRAGHHRCGCRFRRRGGEDLRVKDLRQFDLLLVGEFGHHRR